MVPRPASPLLALDRRLLDEEDGFASWSAHLLDSSGSGVALSWGFGLPLARLHGGPRAAKAPWLSLLVFAQGTPSLWIGQRYPEEATAWEAPAGRWRLGSSQIEALRDPNAQVVIARLDCALPGSKDRLTGHVELGGVPRRVERGRSGQEPAGDEDWSPLTGFGEGRCVVNVGRAHHFHLAGRAFHQRHGRAGALPQPVAWCAEGHVPFADRDVSFQARLDEAGRGEASGLTVFTDGKSEAVEGLVAVAEGLPGDVTRLILYHGEDKWLEASTEHLTHDRGLERQLVARCRASMALPALGLLSLTRTAPAPALARSARSFAHVVGTRPPLAVRLETGPVRGRWRRALPFG